MSYTVNHAITGSRYGEPLDTLAKAQRYAKRLSLSRPHSLDIFEFDGLPANSKRLVAFAVKGELTMITGRD